MLIYLASAYSIGDQALNVRRQIEVADKLLAMGHTPIVPCLSHLWHLISPKPYEEWLQIGMVWLSYCDALLRLDGKSVGADLEEAEAKRLCMLIYYDLREVPGLTKK